MPDGKPQNLGNPSLLAVKMLLADIRSWRHRYKDGEYVCSDFAREVCDKATDRGVRCGYVAIRFDKREVGHAVVAFETDYGLKFFEPQTGEEVDLVIGRRYGLTEANGVTEDAVVAVVSIGWNDGGTSALMGDTKTTNNDRPGKFQDMWDGIVWPETPKQIESLPLPEGFDPILKLFEATQCSWCARFYTQPWVCPFGKLQSSCPSFAEIPAQQRTIELGNGRWAPKIDAELKRASENGVMAKCRFPDCFALNPNPQETVCWKCGRQRSIVCPVHDGVLLRYDSARETWRCGMAAHTTTFHALWLP